jgi:hypothetical protein
MEQLLKAEGLRVKASWYFPTFSDLQESEGFASSRVNLEIQWQGPRPGSDPRTVKVLVAS